MDCEDITIDFDDGELRLIANVVPRRAERGGSIGPQTLRPVFKDEEVRTRLRRTHVESAAALTEFLALQARRGGQLGLWCYEGDYLRLLALLDVGSPCPDRVKWPLRKEHDG